MAKLLEKSYFIKEMKLPEDQARLKGLLQETITLLCKNGLNYKAEFSVEALIVVTLDQEQMFHANIKETIAKEGLSLTMDANSEKDVVSAPRSKSAKKRRSQRDDSPEVPKKKSSAQLFSETSLDNLEDDGDELSNASYQNVKEENDSSSECVLVKDELANRTLQDPVPLSDLEYVDTGNDQGSLHYGAGVWNVQSVSGEQDGASNTSGIEGDPSQQEEVVSRPSQSVGTPKQQGMKLPVTRSGTAKTEGMSPAAAVKIDVRGKLMQYTDRRPKVIRRGGKWFRTSQSPIQEEEEIGQKKTYMEGKGIDEQGDEIEEGIEEWESDDEIQNEASENNPEEMVTVALQCVPESVSVDVAGVQKEENLRGIIKSAVDKVRKEIKTPTSSPSSSGVTITTIKGGAQGMNKQDGQPERMLRPIAVQPVTVKRKPKIVPEKLGRGRPINPAVTSVQRSSVSVESPSVVRVTTQKQSIKVLGLEPEDKKRKPKPIVCELCGAAFTSNKSLADHECGEQNLFRCGVCDAMFMRKQNLKRHFNVHKGEVHVEVLETQ